jgi:uncharacterized damage-inducible protein DinB
MTLQEIKLLHAYTAWANNRIFDAVAQLSDEQYMRDMKSSHGGIQGTLNHIVAAEKMWISRLVGKPDAKLMTVQEAPSLADLKAVWEKVGFGMAQFLGTMTDRKLQETFAVTYASGETLTYLYWQAIQHMVDHSSYHRGQIVTMMRQLGVKPPGTGLIGFYREVGKTK